MKKRIILLTAVIIFIAGMTRAQWTTDLGKNTQITCLLYTSDAADD